MNTTEMTDVAKMQMTIGESQNEILMNSQVNIFEDDLNEDEKVKIKEKAEELLTFIADKDANEIRSILENVIIDDIEELETSSELLSAKLDNIDSIKDMDSSGIANSLMKLNTTVAGINPNKFNFNHHKILSFLPFLEKPINKYLKKFKSTKEIIDEIIQGLGEGESLLREDNVVLQHDKQRYKEAAIKLQRKAVIMEHVTYSIEKNLSTLDERERAFYENNLLLYLQKKIRSIYEILVVTQEGFLSNDFIINTNWELIDNISNIKVVTKRALEIGVGMLVALENQKNVLQAVEQTKTVANDLIVGNAKRMNHQANEIYMQAGSATLSLESLTEAFANINEAMNKVNSFKADTLQKVKDEVVHIKEITSQLESKVKEVEQTEKAKNLLSLDIDI